MMMARVILELEAQWEKVERWKDRDESFQCAPLQSGVPLDVDLSGSVETLNLLIRSDMPLSIFLYAAWLEKETLTGNEDPEPDVAVDVILESEHTTTAKAT